MYDYVLYWPTIVKQSLNYLEEGQPKLHTIFRFLMHFSSEFSIYYHRTRILTVSLQNKLFKIVLSFSFVYV